MAKTQKKNLQTKSKTNYFLGCFGCSNNKVWEHKKSAETIPSDGQKKKRWLFWSRSRMKKSGSRTVPVVESNSTTVSEKSNPKNKYSKSKSKPDQPGEVTKHKPPCQEVQVASDQTPNEILSQLQETTYEPHAQNIINIIIPEKGEHPESDHFDTPKDDTCKIRSSFCRKIEAIRTGSSQPEVKSKPKTKPKSKPKPTEPTTISHSVSNLDKRVAKANGSSTNSRGALKNNDTLSLAKIKKLDPVAGLSIIMVTLLITLFWGRFFAIICTSAWCYIVPSLRNLTKLSDDVIQTNLNSQDYDSGEYKKKVILEGFLKRNHRNPK